MNNPIFFDSSNSINLFGLQSNFDFLTKLYENKNLPKVLMLTGEKGSGKSTLINHFLFSIFDSSNYNRKEFCLSESSYLLKQLKGNIFSNIIYIKEFNIIKYYKSRFTRN